MKILVVLLTIFVLWTHFAPEIEDVYHHYFVSVSSRFSASSGCKLEPVMGIDWYQLRVRLASRFVDSECYEEWKIRDAEWWENYNNQ